MKLVLLHGPSIKVSRLNLLSIKEKFNNSNIVVFESGSNISEIVGTIMTEPLIREPRLVILENPQEDLSISTLNYSDLTLVLWFDHEVSNKKPVMEWIKKSGQILFFPEGKEISIFPFLDYLASGDKKAFLELKKLKSAGFEMQYFITMVFYLLRNLIVTPKNAPQFVRDKLQRQRKNFNLERVISLYSSILEIDLGIKSGLTDSSHAEFLLVNKFIEHPNL